MATRFEQAEHLVENFGDTGAVLREVVDAMSDRDFDDIYQHIVRMWDLEDM